MSASTPQKTLVSRSSQQQGQPSKASQSSSPAWLEGLLFNAKLMAAGADAFPFPYVKGVFGTVVFLLEAVQKVKQNQESMKELCGDTMDIITVLRDQISAHGDTAALKFKAQCEELEAFLQDVLDTVNLLRMKPRGFGARFKEVIKASSTVDDISRFRTRMQELRSNLMLMATMDTNFQVQKVLTVISPDVPVVQVPQQINNCLPPSKIFHGRQIILQQMHEYFTQTTGTQDIFLLHGLGGAGKTQIALKFIAKSTSNFTDIFFIDSSSIETIETGLKNIAKTKVVGESSQDALQWLQSKEDEWLLFFDNADDPKINLNDYFPQCDHGNIIITSRNPGLVVHASSHSVVSDMEEVDAVDLLLRSAGEEATDDNKTAAVQIVEVLHCLPLAIVQAGSFISQSGDLDSYLALYEQNRARLLSQKPAQSHDSYAWTIYTTWQISFNQLSPPAAIFLQLCSLLHHQGISEQIFKNAATYKFGPSSPSKEELQMPLQYLSQFLGPDGVWDSFCFMDMTNEIRAYSLINFHPPQKMFSIHPLVHDWTRSTLSNKEPYHHWMVGIVGMSLARLSEEELQLASLWIQPHIDFLMQDNSNVIPDFRHEYGKIYVWGEKLKKAEEFQTAVLQKRRHLLGEDHPDTLGAMFWLATIYIFLGKWKEAEQFAVVVLKQRRNILGDDHPDTLDVMGNLAVICHKLGKLKEAEQLGVAVLDKQRNILGDKHQNTLPVTSNLALIYQDLGKLKEAEELQLVVLEKERNVLGDNHPSTLITMANLAVTSQKLGKLKEAEDLGIAVLERQRNVLGDHHPSTLMTMANLAYTYKALGRLKEAEELQLVVLEKWRNVLGDNHPSTLMSMANLACTYTALGRFKEAEELELVALEKQRNVLGDNHPSTLITMGNLAVTSRKLGKLKEAEELGIAALEGWRNILGDNHTDSLRTMGHLAATYNKLESWQEAEKLGVAALKKQMDFLGDKHEWTLETMQNLAVTYEQLGKSSEADGLNAILRGSQV
ncbi:hypothetical protein C8R44DRAFT_862422 [Mycena epipterygia]|nr:hypothetical protein C8R44DRAFT_862422 [Mycena epipterygia]